MKKNIRKNDSIKGWYMAAYPTDEIAGGQLFGQTFSELTTLLKNSLQDAVDYIGECDTQVRERIIGEAWKRMGK